MALFDRQRQRARRVDPRKLKGDGLRGFLSSLNEPRNMMRMAVLLLLVVGTLVLMLTPYEPLQYRKDQSTEVSIVSRVSFEFVDEAATNKKREEARNTTPRVYSRDLTAMSNVREEFFELLRFASEKARPPKPAPEDAAKDAPAPPPPPDNATDAASPTGQPATAPASGEAPVDPLVTEETERKKRVEALKKSWDIEDEFGQLVELAKDDAAREQLVKDCEAVVTHVQGLPILSDPDHFYERGHTELTHIFVFDNGNLVKQDKTKTPPLNVLTGSTQDLVENKVNETFAGAGLSTSLRNKIRDRFVKALVPTLRYDDARTKAQQDEAVSNVKPVMREFRRKDVLVPRDSEIGDEELKILAKEHEAYLADLSVGQRIGAVAGSLMLAALLISLLAAFTALYQPNVVARPIRGLIIVVLILSVLVVAKFVRYWPPLALFQLVTVAMVLTIAYNRRFALVLAWWTAALAVLVTRLDFNTVLLMAAGSSIAVLQLETVRSRLKLTYVGLWTGAALMLTIWATTLWDREMSSDVGATMGYGLLAMAYGLLAGIFVLGILPFIERVFGVVTHISLLEFCDANQPALKKLAIEAPGTYSHSLLLGSIVEPAAEAIGANGLLARVGAYFHDIGKVNKPHYFTENRNQLGDAPDHDNLTPQMSKLIITSHIKDGLDMAEQYGLPRAINAFIAEHHGTTVIEYFYYEALKSSDGPIDETEFRYPGPRPQSKETAILMLADSCEGAVRSIKEPTPPKIEDRVHQIVMKRLLDGQLDESGLSLNEVRTIEQSLTKSLMSVHHGRIAYPNERQQQEAAAANAQRNHSGEGASGAARTDSNEGHS